MSHMPACNTRERPFLSCCSVRTGHDRRMFVTVGTEICSKTDVAETLGKFLQVSTASR